MKEWCYLQHSDWTSTGRGLCTKTGLLDVNRNCGKTPRAVKESYFVVINSQCLRPDLLVSFAKQLAALKNSLSVEAGNAINLWQKESSKLVSCPHIQ